MYAPPFSLTNLFPHRLTIPIPFSFQGIASFTKLAEAKGLCIAVAERVLRNTKPEDFDLIIERLSTKPQARVVIMFVNEDNTR